jgi:hypothetical protein
VWRKIDGQEKIPICNTIDSLWTLYKIHYVESLEEFQLSLLGKVPTENTVPNNEPSMFNILNMA